MSFMAMAQWITYSLGSCIARSQCCCLLWTLKQDSLDEIASKWPYTLEKPLKFHLKKQTWYPHKPGVFQNISLITRFINNKSHIEWKTNKWRRHVCRISVIFTSYFHHQFFLLQNRHPLPAPVVTAARLSVFLTSSSRNFDNNGLCSPYQPVYRKHICKLQNNYRCFAEIECTRSSYQRKKAILVISYLVKGYCVPLCMHELKTHLKRRQWNFNCITYHAISYVSTSPK